MLTLSEYLYARGRKAQSTEPAPAVPPEPDPETVSLEFAASLIAGVSRHVMAPPEHADLREKLSQASGALPKTRNQRESGAVFDAALREFQTRAEKTSKGQQQDMYKMLTMLNEALMLLASGSERTVSILKQLEVSLERAATIQDVTTLRSKLSEVVRFLREESRKEREQSEASVTSMDQQLREVRESITWLRLDLPGREEALAALQAVAAENVTAAGDGRNPLAAVFVLDRLRAITARYGEDTVRDLVQELVSKHIRPLASESQPFRWSDDAVLLLMPQSPGVEEVNAKITRDADRPFEHKIFAGARVATLRVNMRWVVMPVAAGTTLNEDIDRFVEGVTRR